MVEHVLNKIGSFLFVLETPFLVSLLSCCYFKPAGFVCPWHLAAFSFVSSEDRPADLVRMRNSTPAI